MRWPADDDNLLERPGHVVLREDIRLRLWPNNTIVEFDHSINAAIKRLRNALGESAQDPRFIETLAKRGYRFACEVTNDVVTTVGSPQGAPAEGDGLVGKTFSHYRVIEKLGSGGRGVVYRAEDMYLGRQVAVKVLEFASSELPDSACQRFEREARAASVLNHPNICTIHSVDQFRGLPVIVMELVEGETLAWRLERGPIPYDETVKLATQANVMLTKSGAKVLDFGIARFEGWHPPGNLAVTEPGTVLGTVGYMSPEQVRGARSITAPTFSAWVPCFTRCWLAAVRSQAIARSRS